ncbi:MAG: transmembrane anchor protein [Desulfobacula sp.]|jgi:hypothetical protein|nr:transmembrane anchor protein [Desulfobacula sp.]
MYNSNIPSDRELPSSQKLIKSTIFAGVVAAILLITTVLPAEYGIDPTGIGNAIGLKKMGEIKVSLEKEATTAVPEDVQKTVQDQKSTKTQVDLTLASVKPVKPEPEKKIVIETISVTLKPDQGTEVKTKMRKDEVLKYKWSTDGGRANFDVHADSKKLKIKYHNYEKGSKKIKEGSITAAFDGSHGWFWRNRTSKTLTIVLEVSGEFEKLERM